MITGFNTDIEFQGTTYHVQTEDKGVKTPLILSLVYDRGTILASKRSTYNDLLVGEFDEKILIERLQKQHNLICAAVRTGRIEDLKRMAAKEAALKQQKTAAEKEAQTPIAPQVAVAEQAPVAEFSPVEAKLPDQIILPENQTVFVSPVQKSGGVFTDLPSLPDDFAANSTDEMIWEVPISVVEDDEAIIEAVEIIDDDDLILSDEAVAIIADSIVGENNNDKIADNRLQIRLLNEEKLVSGAAQTLCILVNRGGGVRGLKDVQVIFKILGSSFSPIIFHTQTDSNGIATIHLQLPYFRSGRAALLVKAISGGEEVDFRRAITHD